MVNMCIPIIGNIADSSIVNMCIVTMADSSIVNMCIPVANTSTPYYLGIAYMCSLCCLHCLSSQPVLSLLSGYCLERKSLQPVAWAFLSASVIWKFIVGSVGQPHDMFALR